jgi:hypothetical protein
LYDHAIVCMPTARTTATAAAAERSVKLTMQIDCARYHMVQCMKAAAAVAIAAAAITSRRKAAPHYTTF